MPTGLGCFQLGAPLDPLYILHKLNFSPHRLRPRTLEGAEGLQFSTLESSPGRTSLLTGEKGKV